MNGERGFWSWVAFWTPAVALLFFFGRRLFREQWGELRTLRLLMNRIGPYYPDFDPPNLNTWVARCAPHVFHGWRVRSFAGLADFATPACVAAAETVFEAQRRAGQVFVGRFEKVLKTHFLDVRMGGPGPAPADVELRLRIEIKGTDEVHGPGGERVAGTEALSQLQQFWTLRHDGRQWRLAAVTWAKGDLPPLPPAAPLPGLLDWKRPAVAGEERGETT